MKQSEKQNQILQDMKENALSIAQQQRVIGGTSSEPETSKTGGEALSDDEGGGTTSITHGEALSSTD